jgi:hypothetical protein
MLILMARAINMTKNWFQQLVTKYVALFHFFQGLKIKMVQGELVEGRGKIVPEINLK